jgi:hypothetical protein
MRNENCFGGRNRLKNQKEAHKPRFSKVGGFFWAIFLFREIHAEQISPLIASYNFAFQGWKVTQKVMEE